MDLDEVFQAALAEYGGNQAALARQLRRSPSVVGNWLMGRFKPDYESCLRLAQITGRPAAAILRSAGHDPSILPVETADDASPRVPLSIQQREVHHQYERWLRVMGPRMGEKEAEDFFWTTAKQSTAPLVSIAELGAADNGQQGAAANPADNDVPGAVSGDSDGAGGPLTHHYPPVLALHPERELALTG